MKIPAYWFIFHLCSPQDIVYLQPGVDIAALLTAPTCMCLEATTQTLRKQVEQKMKTILFSGNFGGFILPRPPGNRSVQRGTRPQSWHLCQVWTPSSGHFYQKCIACTPSIYNQLVVYSHYYVITQYCMHPRRPINKTFCRHICRQHGYWLFWKLMMI